MTHRFSRTELLIGEEGLNIVARSHVAVFGVGGVGSYAVEALARCGVGTLTLVDYDEVCISNINRQVHALESTIGMVKVDIMAERVKQINPQAVVYPKQLFYRPGMDNDPLHAKLDYVIDAVDNVPAKLGI
ncbi:MAG: ThiF family adenylyltransferase, partial [Methanobacteriaceae archaeon]|nr:ThiF family adenylyltransferase [Methanobacteriaceae archaeon]